ncbi:DUF885 family protein, partial [Sphaerisporangium krabiense]
LDTTGEPVAVQVNARLLGCALDRAHWELDLLRGWRRNPCFYIDQSLVPVYNLLLVSTPITPERATAIIRLLDHVPVVLAQARENLAGEAAKPFATSALRILADADTRLDTAMTALAPFLPEARAAELPAATARAVTAVRGYRDWLRESLPTFAPDGAAGSHALRFLLHRVALLPYSVEQIRELGRQEWTRALATEAMLGARHRGHTPRPVPGTAEQIARQHAAEQEVRRFYTGRDILTQPPTLRHYRFAPCPPYLEPLIWLGVPDDLTSPARAGEDAVRYVVATEAEPPYFERAAAIDPRTMIAHEGVHAQQVALSWRHPDPARRRFYDSTPNEGIAFYNEELMLLSGLFDDSPEGAAFAANAMRLRALRVEVDIALALGELTVEAAADRLRDLVPMDEETAWDEAVFFLGNPGQGLSYQIGKLQILDLLATATQRPGFTLRTFHDDLWQEGNVPLSLHRWQSLNLPDHLHRSAQLAAALS